MITTVSMLHRDAHHRDRTTAQVRLPSVQLDGNFEQVASGRRDKQRREAANRACNS
jgi:hypothetical protein